MANASVYAMLLVAIVLEVIGTTALQMSQQFTRPDRPSCSSYVTSRPSTFCH